MIQSRLYVWAVVFVLLTGVRVLRADLPVITVETAQRSLDVRFSIGGIWFLLPDGNVYYLGSPWGGGSAKSYSSASPLSFGRATNWLDLGASNTRGFGILADHSLVTWGHWDVTNLNSGPALRPTPFPTEIRWSIIAVGDEATAGIDMEGRLWTWGDNVFSGRASPRSIANNIPSEPLPDSRWLDITAANFRFAGLRADGTVWVWGHFPWRSSGITHAVPVQTSSQTNWTAICTILPLVVRNRDGELWQLQVPGNDYPWSQSQILLTNAIPGRYALSRGRIWEITAGGQLWVRPNPAFPDGLRETFKPHPIGDRRDWVRLWSGAGSVVGTTRDGMVWVWGTDWISEPQYPVETHAMLLMNRMKKVVGLEQTPVSRDGTLRYIAEPAPVFQFLSLEGLGPPLIEFLGGTTTNP